MKRRRVIFGLLGILALSSSPSFAAENKPDHDDDDRGDHGHRGNERDDPDRLSRPDHDFDDDDEPRLAQEAVRQGKAHRLKDIIREVKAKYPGEIVKVAVGGTVEHLTYSIRVLTPDDRLINLKVDAKSRKITEE